MLGFSDPRKAAAGWAEALRGWRSNPLGKTYQQAEAQRLAALPWQRRSPGLLIFGGLLALAVFAVNSWLLLDSLALSGHGARPQLAASASLGLGSTLAAALLFCLCWLAGRGYHAFAFALGFLDRAPRSRFRHSLDDMLAVTALSEQELLTGALRYGAALLGWPLLASSALLALFGARMMGAASPDAGFPLALGVALLVFLALWLPLLLSAALACAALLLIAIGLSLCERAGVWPAVGACGLVLLQLLLCAGGLLGQQELEQQLGGEAWGAALLRGGSGAVLLLLTLLLLYLARRMEQLRKALQGGFGPLLALPYVLLAALFAVNIGYDTPEGIMLLMLAPLGLLSAVNLVPLLLAAEQQSLAVLWPYWLSLLPLQLLLAAAAAEFARDAIRRRKWNLAA